MAWTRGTVYETNNSLSDVVVPTKWVEDGWIYWSNGLNASKDLTNQVTPLKSWPKYKIKKILLSSDEYDVCVNYNFSSSSSSDENTDTRKKKNENKQPSPKIPSLPSSPIAIAKDVAISTPDSPVQRKPSYLFNDSPGVVVFERDTAHRLPSSLSPSPKLKQTKSATCQQLFCEQPKLRRSPRQLMKRKNKEGSSSKLTLKEVHSADRSSTTNCSASLSGSSQSVSQDAVLNITTSAKDKYPLSEASFQRKCVKQFADIKAQLREIREVMGNRCVGETEVITFEQCESLEELAELDERIKTDNEDFQSLVSYLKRQGDSKFDVTVKNIMLAISNYGVWAKYTFYGSDTKKSLSSLKIFEAIKGRMFW